MGPGRLHRVCWAGGLIGLLLGGSAVAQEHAATVASGSEADFWLRLVASGGLPAVLGFLGYWLPRAASSLVQSGAAAIASEFRDGLAVRLTVPEDGIPLRLAPADLAELARGVSQLEALHRRVDELATELEARRVPPVLPSSR